MCQALRRSHVPGTSCCQCAPQNFASILSERERSSVFERDRMCQALRRSHVPGTSCWECAPQNFASILSERERLSMFERNQGTPQPCASRSQVRPNWSFKDEESNTVDHSGPLNVRSPCREQRRLCPTWQRRLREPDTNLWWRAISISTRSSHDQRAGQRCYVLARPVLPLA